MVVFGESDTVAHHFWRFHDRALAALRAEPARRRDPPRLSRARRGASGAWSRPPADASVAVVSDHGSGGAERSCRAPEPLPGGAAGCSRFRARSAERPRDGCAALAVRAVPHRARRERCCGARRRRRGASKAARASAASTGTAPPRSPTSSTTIPSVWLNVDGSRARTGRLPRQSTSVCVSDVARALEGVAGRRRAAGGGACLAPRGDATAARPIERAPDLLLELATVDGYSPRACAAHGPGPALRRLAPRGVRGGEGGRDERRAPARRPVRARGPGRDVRWRAARRRHRRRLADAAARWPGCRFPSGSTARPSPACSSGRRSGARIRCRESAAIPTPYGRGGEPEIAARLAEPRLPGVGALMRVALVIAGPYPCVARLAGAGVAPRRRPAAARPRRARS